MVKSLVTGSDEDGYLPTEPIDPTLLAAVAGDPAGILRASELDGFHQMAMDPTVVPGQVQLSAGHRGQVLLECAVMKAAIRIWYTKQPDEVIREAQAFSARCTELWTELRLLEPYDRQYSQLRTMQVQPILDEIDRQYKFVQSKIAIARQDIDLIRGGT